MEENIPQKEFMKLLQRCWDQYPQQNGVAERKNRTIMEAVKTMIHDQDLPMCLWAEAAMAAVYVQNRLSHSALGFKTPEEMFTGKKPEVIHLKIFGCPVFIHIPKEKRNKLEPSRKEGNICGILCWRSEVTPGLLAGAEPEAHQN
jgi:hypothetical protein